MAVWSEKDTGLRLSVAQRMRVLRTLTGRQWANTTMRKTVGNRLPCVITSPIPASYLPAYLPTYLPVYLPIYLPACLPTTCRVPVAVRGGRPWTAAADRAATACRSESVLWRRFPARTNTDDDDDDNDNWRCRGRKTSQSRYGDKFASDARREWCDVGHAQWRPVTNPRAAFVVGINFCRQYFSLFISLFLCTLNSPVSGSPSSCHSDKCLIKLVSGIHAHHGSRLKTLSEKVVRVGDGSF